MKSFDPVALSIARPHATLKCLIKLTAPNPQSPNPDATMLTPEQHLADLEPQFRKHFPQLADVPLFAAVAPGRVNLIGEHTDYNDGFVLPMGIERHTLILAAPRDDHQVNLHTTVDHLSDVSFDLAAAMTPPDQVLQPETEDGRTWANYLKGVVAGFLARGIAVPGFNAMLASTVPSGGGLSSSASIEVATATLLEALTTKTIDPVDKALLAQKAEHDFANVPCGIMDQFISTMAQRDHALLIDCRSHETQAVPLSDPAVSVLIINSNLAHALVDGEYRLRREQCEAAAKALNVKALRDADMALLETKRDEIDEVTFRRARHVITENQRTVHAAEAMTQGDFATMGKLMLQSHASMRDDYEITVPPIDLLVELASKHIESGDVFGSRMTGGGFGGCTVTLVKTEAIDKVTQTICDAYEKETGIEPTAFATRPAGGTRRLDIPA